ncbi:hypothetical protein FQN57_003485 [Myotisia sp. PD_48]|nr:hypothetical protein FQN57_003485 [Myotisia sp. PD_48]
MSSLTLKVSSLVIRTISKPIAVGSSFRGNRIKAQAREHERFRHLCVSIAQTLHRVDMRLRLGLLYNTATLEKQAAREAAEAHAKKLKAQTPTVKTEAQMKIDESATTKGKEKLHEAEKPPPAPRIRPLSEAKAIDTGANFISESFLFLVAGGLIIFESFRSRRKELNRREGVADRLEELEESERQSRAAMVTLEKEVLRLRAQLEKRPVSEMKRVLPKERWEVGNEPPIEPKPQSIITKITSFFQWSNESSSVTESPSTDPTKAQVPVASASPSNSH